MLISVSVTKGVLTIIIIVNDFQCHLEYKAINGVTEGHEVSSFLSGQINNNNWLMVGVRQLSYECAQEVAKHNRSTRANLLKCLATSQVHP